MTTLEEAAEHEFGFNPSQVRGPDGKWLHVGAAVKHAVHGKGTVTDTHALGKVSVRFDRGGLKKVGGKELHPSSHDPLDRASERPGHKRLGDLVKSLGGEKEIERRKVAARTRRLDNPDLF